MADVLFLAHRIPYPPDKGDKIRSWHMLKHLAARATVHLGAFVDDPADMAHADALRSVCGDVLLRPIKRSDRWKRAARGLLRGDALSLALYRDPAMADWVRETVRRRRPDGLFVFSSQMAPYALPYLGPRRGVMDFVDVDSEKWFQYAREGRGWRQHLYNREGRLLRDLEKHAARQFDASLFVSEAEAALFRRIAGSYAHTVLGVSNGVDFDFFDPRVGAGSTSEPGEPTVVFTGAMDYRPNVDAVLWFAAEVWPRVRSIRPRAAFLIVGSKPLPEVKKLDGRDGIVVTGRVDDVRPYIAGADVVVAPLRIARGIQNKVLEAMAMAKPVVATTAAFEGIEAVPGEHLLVEDEADAFAARVLDLAGDPTRARAIGGAARSHVSARYAWSARLAPLDDILGLTPAVPAAAPEPARAVAT